MSQHPDGPYLSRPGPNLAAGALALGVHVLFALLLIFGVSWQTRHPEPVAVDIWDAPPPPPPRPERAEPAPQPAPPPKPVEEKPAPPQPEAPDIALEKKKAEAKARADAEAERARKLKAVQEAEAKSQAEAKRLEAEALRKTREKEAAERKKKELLRQAEEEEMQRIAKEEAAAEAQQLKQAQAKQAEARAAAARRQSEVDRLVGLHRDKISAKVRSNTRLPATLKGNPEVRCLVRLLPTGEVQSVRVIQSSGDPAYDEAVVLAIEKSSPLPLPADRDARAAFVPELSFVHRPKE